MYRVLDAAYDLYILDFDGTVISSHEVMRDALAECCKHEGVQSPPYDKFFSMMGAPLGDILGAIGLGGQVQTYQAYSRRNMHRVALVPGMLGALRELSSRGKRLALFTGKERQRTGELLERLGLSPAFELVITSDDVERGKPHAEGLLRILSFTGVAASRALMVGDGLFDLECAMAADVDSALVGWGAIDLATHRLPMVPRWILDAPAQLYRSAVPLASGAGR